MTRTGDREIRSVSGRLPDNPGELACMTVGFFFPEEPALFKICACKLFAPLIVVWLGTRLQTPVATISTSLSASRGVMTFGH